MDALYSPRSSLRVMHEVGISYAGNQKLRSRSSREGKPHLLASRRKLDFERKNLEADVEYVIDQDVIRLKYISHAVSKRLEHIGPNVKQTALLSVDKGQGRVLSTIAFPYRHQGKNSPSHPSSDTNHLVIKSWSGEDKYDALSSRLNDIYPVIANELKLNTLIGGDLAYLCANFGCHPSMSAPCPICDHHFDKAISTSKDKISFDPIVLPKKPKAVPRKTPIWPVDVINVS